MYRFTNTAQHLDFLFNINADLMTYVNTNGKFEGADVAADCYRRNIRIFANFNRTAISPEDKVLVLYGASHVAFFHDFMKRSHRYNVKDILEFLKENCHQNKNPISVQMKWGFLYATEKTIR